MGGGAGIVGAGLSGARRPPHVDIVDPIDGSEGLVLEPVPDAGGRPIGNSRSVLAVALGRLDFDATPEIPLDGRRNTYFLAWTMSNIAGSVFCPPVPHALLGSMKCPEAATAAVPFPDTLHPGNTADDVPFGLIRSAYGVRLFGDRETD